MVGGRLLEQGSARGAWWKAKLESPLQTKTLNASPLPASASVSDPHRTPQGGVGWRMTQSLTLTEPSIFNTAAPTFLEALGSHLPSALLRVFSMEFLLSGRLFQSYHPWAEPSLHKWAICISSFMNFLFMCFALYKCFISFGLNCKNSFSIRVSHFLPSHMLYFLQFIFQVQVILIF